ncbi:MBL fold metallo-hydrolase [Paenibacillus physcomitrellae]|uniref:Hydrolase n=1 Tax=Paenibacillus physcomitrellae TaxID=1619311 RepID=A0ABQ1G698_9BACL|nr:MBL fold metallo-hydrolase [Paenibacillus physcomitrellae]GGA37587.1 hydrolase [Paenibacillus physcomitrellae]
MIQKLSQGIFDLNLEHNGMHPVLIWSEQDGATLIDTGMPGSLEVIQESVREAGVAWNDIRRIILTHQDIDHIGSLPAIVASLPSKPEIWAHSGDADVIEGKAPFLKMGADRIATMPEPMRQALEQLSVDLKDIRITRLLEDGEQLPVGGGLRVIYTPGHTPGHICLYVPEEELLLAADQLIVKDGLLTGPNEAFTPDMPLAIKSMSKLTSLAIRRVLCYHGGVYDQQPEEAIEKLAHASN